MRSLLFPVLVFGITGCYTKAKVNVLDAIEGNWKVVQMVTGSGSVDVQSAKRMLISFNEGSYSMVEMASSGSKVADRGTVNADGGKDPLEIDLTRTDGPDAGQTRMGVIEIEGDKLKIALGEPGKSRPKQAAVGTNNTFMVLQREK